MQFDQFSQAINIFEESNSNKQTRVERERGLSVLVYQTRIKKNKLLSLNEIQMVTLKLDIAIFFSNTLPNGSFLWFIFLSQNNLSSGNLRANWPFVTKTSFHADIRLKYPRNFRINLILCLQFGVFSLTEQWNGNYYFRFGIWTEIIIIKRTSNANIWKA